MFKRVGVLALILSAATALQPAAAFAQERYEDRYYGRGDRDRHRDRHEWREHERREWREHERREWREDRRDRDYDRRWRYRDGRAYYYEAAPPPYYWSPDYYYGR